MKYKILLNVTEDTHQVEEEEKLKFLRVILETLEVPLDFWDPEEPFSFEIKNKLQNEILNYNIEVLDQKGGELEIYKQKELIAKFYKPIYKIKTNLKEINPRKKLYLEMEVFIEAPDLIPEE